MRQLRRTKIIATVGPALDDKDVLMKTIMAGVNIFRANFSHGDVSKQIERIDLIRQVAKELSKEIGILADLQGPKIRISRFKNKKIILKEGAVFCLDATLPEDQGDEQGVGIDYKELINDVFVNDTLLLDDGRLILQIEKIENPKITCRVIVGGILSDNKGINRQGGGLSAPVLTDKDKRDMKKAVELAVDYIAISFPRSADDMHQARILLETLGGNAALIAKIERVEAVKAIDDIIRVSDGVMVARGDLGVEVGDAELPGIQKHIIRRARTLNKPVITATQMLETMIHNTIPTRAEVSDVANAVLDGTDAVMLSAETAVGEHPVKVIEAMDRICLGAEKHPCALTSGHRIECHFEYVDEAIAMATMYTANHLSISAIICLTESGGTPLWMSRIRSGIPIYGLSRHAVSRRKMTLYRGVYPVHFDPTQFSQDRLSQSAVAELQKRQLINPGELVIITKGDLLGVHGRTNSMEIFTVPEN